MKLETLPLPLSLVVMIGLFAVIVPVAAQSTTSTSCEASLDGSQEVPPVDTNGEGSATMTFEPTNNKLTWSIEFSNLAGSATAAHFHGPAAEGNNAAVQVNIGDVSGLNSPMKGSAALTPEQASWLLNDQLYINIHTADNPNGEIRGQVSCQTSSPDDGSLQTATVVVGDKEYNLKYSINGGTLDEMTADPETQTLTASISSTSDGNLTLWLPTKVIDVDKEFAVFIDGQFGNFIVDELEPTEGARVLQIGFEDGAEEIEIVGTSMAVAEELKPEKQTIPVEIGGRTYDIPYEVTGGSLQSASANVDSKSLMFTMSSNASGILTLWLPTNVIDADGQYSLFIDGKSANLTELEPTANARVLQIGFDEGTKEIEILGTSIVPEFGAFPIILTSIVIVGVVVATKKFSKVSR